MTPVIAWSKLTTVLSAKLLKPLISKFFNLTVSDLFLQSRTNSVLTGKYIGYGSKKDWQKFVVFYSYTQIFHRSEKAKIFKFF
jgi:hypothetical protein